MLNASAPLIGLRNRHASDAWFRIGCAWLIRRFIDPQAFAIMSNCANTAIGVWSENSLDRSVVVAVYGRPGDRKSTRLNSSHT